MFLCKGQGLSQSLLFHEKLYPIGLKKKKLLLDKLLRDDNEEDKPKSNFITKYLDKRRKSQSPNNYAKTYDYEQNDILK